MDILLWVVIAAAGLVAILFVIPVLIFLYAKAARYGYLKANEMCDKEEMDNHNHHNNGESNGRDTTGKRAE